MAQPVEDPRLRLAYLEGQAALARQADTLEKLRTRSTGLLTIASVAASVLGAFALPDKHAHWYQLLTFGAGIATFVALVVLTCLLLQPVVLTTENDPKMIVESYVDMDYDINSTLRWLAVYAQANWETNDATLDKLFVQYVAAIALVGGVVVMFGLSLGLGAI